MNVLMKAMLFDYPDNIPVSVSFLPATWAKYREDLSALVSGYPEIFNENIRANRNYDLIRGSYRMGRFTDAWGCVWENLHDGFESIVTGHPLPDRESVWNMKVPDTDIGTPHGFMYLRLADLRGFEELMVDFAEEPPELQMLIDNVLEYNVRQISIRLNKEKNPVMRFGDDLGMQHGLAVGPGKWRKYLKPCYKKLYGMCHEKGVYVYMHTDGCIYEIIPDLVECGVNIVNPQFRANGLENLVRTCREKVCIDIDLDRQMFPFCTPADIHDHVKAVVDALSTPRGGLMLHAECAPDVPLANIEAICEAMMKYRKYR